MQSRVLPKLRRTRPLLGKRHEAGSLPVAHGWGDEVLVVAMNSLPWLSLFWCLFRQPLD